MQIVRVLLRAPLPKQVLTSHNKAMIKLMGTLLILLCTAAVPAIAVETGAGVSIGKPTTHNVLTDMLVPPPCLDAGKTICAQLPENSTRQLIYGAGCFKLTNKTANPMFIPLRTDHEIEQFLLNAPATQIEREGC